MVSSWVGGVISFAVGALISFLIFRMNLKVMKKNPEKLASFSVVRQLISAGYLFVVFFLSRRLPWGTMAMLLGAAIGLTVPSIMLAFRLASINESVSAKSSVVEDDTIEGGDDAHG